MIKKNYLFSFIFLFIFALFLIGCERDQIPPEPDSFKVSFFDNQDKLLKEETVEIGNNATAPVVDPKEGYSFVRWDKDFSNVQDNIKVKAIFIQTHYSIIYNSMGGTNIGKINYEIDKGFNFPTPEKEGYIFSGWFLDLNDQYPFFYNDDVDFTQPITLYAKWTAKQRQVYYHTDDNDYFIRILAYNEEIYLPILEKPNYIFDGWYLDKELTNKFSVGLMKDEDIHLYPKWNPVKYNITLDVNGGDALENTQIKIEFGNSVTLDDLPIPTKPNGEFIGWKYRDVLIDSSFNHIILEDIHLVAQWIYVDPKYNEFDEFISNMDRWVSDTKSYSLYTLEKIKSNFAYLSRLEELNTLIDKENYYQEVYKDSNYEIVKIDGDNVYLLKVSNINGTYFVDTDYLFKLGDLPAYVDLSYKQIFNKYMYYEKINNNHYKITANYENGDYNELLKLLSLDEFDTMYSKFTVIYEIQYNPTSENYSIRIKSDDFKVIKDGYNLESKLEYIFEYNKFDELNKFDLENENVVFLQPDSMDTVMEITDINIPIESNQTPKPHFYKIELETGQYTILLDQINYNNIVLYDLDGNLYDLGIFWSRFIKNSTFIINEGTYYLSVNNPNINHYKLEFKKLDYTSIYNFDNPIQLEETNQVEVEGKYDFIIYKYESDKEGVLDLYSDVILDIYYIDTNNNLIKSQYNFSKYPSLSNYVPINVGINYIIITDLEAITTTLDVEFIRFTEYSTEVEEMIQLTDEYNSDYYVFNKSIYFRIDVTNPGTYKIDYELELGSVISTIEFYNIAYNKSYFGTSAYLMEGTYYVKIPTYIPLSRIKVKYSYTSGYDNGYISYTNNVKNYEVINIFLEKDEEFVIPVNEIFKNSNIEISSFSLNIKNNTFITNEGAKIKGLASGSFAIYISLYEGFTKTVYSTMVAYVHIEDKQSAIEIRNFDDLIKINNNLSGNYILKADIDLSGIDWIPIGVNTNSPFTGEFINPDGYTISNLECSSDNCGLFGLINNGYISGLKLRNININTTPNEYGDSFAGGIALGIYRSTIYNSSVTGTIISHSRAGGIVGSNGWGQIINCSFEGNITVKAGRYSIAGGIVGENTTNEKEQGIYGNVVKANIVSDYYAGGISGKGIYYGGFSNNIFEGKLTGKITNEQGN